MPEDHKKEYYAFISYKREDKKEAMRLQRALEYYRLPNNLRKDNPALPEYVRPVFRDMTDLEVGELSAQIHSALEESHYLIVVCSPRSAASKWVNNEVEYFISLGKQDKIIPYIIEGVPHSSDLSEECFPPALLRLSKEKELLGANINEVGKDSATIRVISRMFNIRFDTLYQRYQREQKKRRVQLTIVTALAFLFLSAVSCWIWHQNMQLKEREWKMMENQSRAIGEKAKQLIDEGDLMAAMMICSEIMPNDSLNIKRPITPELLSSFYTAFYKYLLGEHCVICHIPTINHHNNDDYDFGIVPGDKYIWSLSHSDGMSLFDIQTGELIHNKLKGHCDDARQFSSDGKYYVSIDENASRIFLQDVSSGNIINESKDFGDNCLSNLRFNSTNTEVSVVRDGVGIMCLTIPSLDEAYLIRDMPYYSYVNEKLNLFADFDSYNVWVGSKDTGNVLYEINDNIDRCSFSDSLFAVSFSGNRSVYVYDFQTGAKIKQYKSASDIDYMRISRDMRYLVLINREEYKMEVYDLTYNLKKCITLPFDMWDYSIDCTQDYLVFYSDIDNNAYKYIYSTNTLVHCGYFEALPDKPYRAQRDGIQPTINVFRSKPKHQIKITQISNPYLIEGEGCFMPDDDNSEEWYDWECGISDSISLFVPFDFSSLVIYNRNSKCKDVLRKNVQNNYNIPVDITNSEYFAVFTKDSLYLYNKNTLGLDESFKINTSDNRPVNLWDFKCSSNGKYLIRPENNNYCIYNTNGEVVMILDGTTFNNVDISPSGKFLICDRLPDSNQCILKVDTGEIIYECEQVILNRIYGFDKNETFLVLGDRRYELAVIDIEQKRFNYIFKPNVKEIEDIALSPSGKYLLTTSPYESSTKLWDIETGTCLFEFNYDDISSVDFSDDENVLILSNHRGELEQFDTYAHSVIETREIPFYPLNKLIDRVNVITNNRQLTPEEVEKYYLK